MLAPQHHPAIAAQRGIADDHVLVQRQRVAGAAFQRLHLDAEGRSSQFGKAALRWLVRYLTEGTPLLHHFANVATSLASRESLGRAQVDAGSSSAS